MIRQVLFFIALSLLIDGCSNNDVDKKFDCDKSDLALSLESISLATRCDVPDGQISVLASGGKGPYSYFINDNAVQSQGTFSALASGVYTVTVKDKNECEVALSNLSVLATGFKFSTTVLENTKCLDGNGSITVDVQEGNGPFTYKVGAGQFSSNNTLTNLRHGNHTVFVADASSCVVQLSVTVPKGNTGTSWSTDVLPIIKTSCAVTGCHDGKTRTDYRIYDNAKRESAQIKKLTKDKSMPFDGPPLTSSQIDLISCWADDGAPSN